MHRASSQSHEHILQYRRQSPHIDKSKIHSFANKIKTDCIAVEDSQQAPVPTRRRIEHLISFLLPMLARLILSLTLALAMLNVAHSAESDTDADHSTASTIASKKTRHHARAESSASHEKSPYGQDPSAYMLTFSDDFDYFNPRVWNDHVWYEHSNPTKNYAVENGVLKIWPQRDGQGKFFNRTIDTDDRFFQTYGYFEIEAKLPRGKGTWPAFWLFNHIGERRPEIDIMEAYAGGASPWGRPDKEGIMRPTAYGATIWFDKGVQATYHQYNARTDLSNGFHKYGLKWEPDRLTFYFDGKPIHTADVSMSDPMYLMLDLWFGSASGQPDDSTPQGKKNAYEVKYVRTWQFIGRGTEDQPPLK
jgi:beta-glucanase (GH16 family)